MGFRVKQWLPLGLNLSYLAVWLRQDPSPLCACFHLYKILITPGVCENQMEKNGCGRSCHSVWHTTNDQWISRIMTMNMIFFFFFENLLCVEGYALSTVISMLSFPFDHNLPNIIVPISEMRKKRQGTEGDRFTGIPGSSVDSTTPT